MSQDELTNQQQEKGSLRTGLAAVSLALGIGAIVIAGFVAAIPAIICGLLAISRAHRFPREYGGVNFAIYGVACGILGCCISAGYVLFFFVAMAPRLAAQFEPVVGVPATMEADRREESRNVALFPRTAAAQTMAASTAVAADWILKALSASGGLTDRGEGAPASTQSVGNAVSNRNGIGSSRFHLNFADVGESVRYLQKGQSVERHAALMYLASRPRDAGENRTVTKVVSALLFDAEFGREALEVMKVWAGREDLPVLRAALRELGMGSGIDSREIVFRKALLGILSGLRDPDSSELFAQNLRIFQVRGDAAAALVALGPDAEDSLLGLVGDTDLVTAQEAIRILGKVGTNKSVPVLQRVMAGSSRSMAVLAATSLEELSKRLDKSPDELVNGLIKHFVVEGPTGFLPDSAFNRPNAKQWVRQMPGRSVKSVFTVEVRAVESGYQIDVPSGAQQMVEVTGGGGLVFRQIASNTGAFSETVRYAALDAGHLIQVSAIVDTGDQTAIQSMNAAVKKIHVR